MKIDKKKIIITVAILLIVVVLLIFKIFINNKNYMITYYADGIPGSKYDIEVAGNKVKIATTSYCSAVDCDSFLKTETYTYSNENIQKLEKFLKKNFTGKKIIVHEDMLSERQREVMAGLVINEYFFELAVEDYQYKIEYAQAEDVVYLIYFKDNNSILVKKGTINKNYDITKIITYELDFSKEHMYTLNEYIKNEVQKEDNNIIYKYSTLKKDEKMLLQSIIDNDEKLLDDYKDGAKLLYTISYDGIYCETPILYLYNDNTYEYFDTYSFTDIEIIPKTGTYNYNIENIIANIDKYEANMMGQYYIKSANNTYTTYNSNIELMEFLSSINVTLEKCLDNY